MAFKISGEYITIQDELDDRALQKAIAIAEIQGHSEVIGIQEISRKPIPYNCDDDMDFKYLITYKDIIE